MSVEGVGHAARLEQLHSFIPVAPEVLEDRSLLRRKDTKFAVKPDQVPALLRALKPDYGVLKAGVASFAAYETLYFDTSSLRCYHDHRRERRARHKVRIRHYPDRKLSYLEVKTKTNGSLTLKHRKLKPYADASMSAADWTFVGTNSGLATDLLTPRLWIGFRRLTLVGFEVRERITIDLDIVFRTDKSEHHLPGVAIVEVKQEPYCSRTPAMLALRSAGMRRTPISKYCVGTMMGDPNIRFGDLSRMLKLIERLQR